jgi:kynurenine formamidase
MINKTRLNLRIVDLSLNLVQGMPGYHIEQNTHLAEDGYNTTNLVIYSHAGTHMDAPRHFLDTGGTIEHLSLEKCIGEALVIDLSRKEPNSLITIADLGLAAEQIGSGSRVLLRTDWDAHANLEDYRTSFPRISLELAEWLAHKGIWLLGLETPSVASLQDMEELTLVHRALLSSKIAIVESLTNLRLLPPDVYFVALPLKITGGDGSPVRAVALIE